MPTFYKIKYILEELYVAVLIRFDPSRYVQEISHNLLSNSHYKLDRAINYTILWTLVKSTSAKLPIKGDK